MKTLIIIIIIITRDFQELLTMRPYTRLALNGFQQEWAKAALLFYRLLSTYLTTKLNT